jgi:hypothetical protein
MDVLEAAIAKANGVNKLGKEIHISGPTISQMRLGVRPVSPEVAAACAEFVGKNPVEAAVEALAAQAKTKEQAAKWRARLRYVAHAACVLAMIGGSTLSAPKEASAGMMKAENTQPLFYEPRGRRFESFRAHHYAGCDGSTAA